MSEQTRSTIEEDSLPLDASFFDGGIGVTPTAAGAASSTTPHAPRIDTPCTAISFATPAPVLQDALHYSEIQHPTNKTSVTLSDGDRERLYSCLDQETDDDPKAQHPFKGDDTYIRIEIERCTQSWTTEGVVPEITHSFFLSDAGIMLSEALCRTDQLLSQMVPKMDMHSRLTLLLNERAMKRVCHVTRLLKARRVAKSKTDPTSAVLWQLAAVQQGCQDEAPLDASEFDQVVALHQQIPASQTRLPLLAACHDILHFEVVSNDTSRLKLIDAASAYVSDLTKHADARLNEAETITERLAAIVDDATDHARVAPSSVRMPHSAINNQDESANTPWTVWRTPNTNRLSANQSPWSPTRNADENERVIPLGTVLTMPYGIGQDLLHEGQFAAHC
eukprot:Lankesteria_metandrocarpae@DN5115_c0_g1_i2.p2